jgi:hypothetical protein
MDTVDNLRDIVGLHVTLFEENSTWESSIAKLALPDVVERLNNFQMGYFYRMVTRTLGVTGNQLWNVFNLRLAEMDDENESE